MTTYTAYPAGYPVTVYGIQGRAGRWWITVDTWHTGTSHDGAMRLDAGPFRSRAAAQRYIAAVDHDDSEDR